MSRYKPILNHCSIVTRTTWSNGPSWKVSYLSAEVGSFNIQKYEPGGHFLKVHSERTAIDTSHRVLAWMTYLNDVEDGGATRFEHQDFESQPHKGKTLIWPGEWTHAHRGNVVNFGSQIHHYRLDAFSTLRIAINYLNLQQGFYLTQHIVDKPVELLFILCSHV